MRSILLRPDSPAVLVLGHFSTQRHEESGFAGPDHWHTIVSQFYDVPHIRCPIRPLLLSVHSHAAAFNSSKAALYPYYIMSPSSISRYFTDPILASTAGHGLLADMLIAYIQSQVCIAWSAARGSGASVPIYYPLGAQTGNSPKDATGLFGGKGLRKGGDDPDAPRPRPANGNPPGLQVPVSRISSQPADLDTFTYEEIAPMCVSANDLVNPLPPSLFQGTGWHAYHPPPTGAPVTDSVSHYWYSTFPTSRLRVPLVVGAGDVGIYFVREPRAVLGSEGGSAVECWVDDNYDGRATIDNEGDSDTEEAMYVSSFSSCRPSSTDGA